MGVVGQTVPGWKPPAPTPMAAAPPVPTFAPPTPPAPPTQDPRIEQLMKAMLQQSAPLTTPRPVSTPNYSAINAQAGPLQNLTSELMAGRAPAPSGPINTDPEAAAYRVAKLREADRARGSEAARLGASNIDGSGDFNGRVAQINENAGESIAGFEGALAGRRKTEALTAATTGAGLQLADLSRQADLEKSRFDSTQHQFDDQAAREERQSALDRQQRSDLLAVLLGQQQQGVTNTFAGNADARANAGAAMGAADFSMTEAGKKFQYGMQPPNSHWDPRANAWVPDLPGQARAHA